MLCKAGLDLVRVAPQLRKITIYTTVFPAACE
jgi:hypothetical protein